MRRTTLSAFVIASAVCLASTAFGHLLHPDGSDGKEIESSAPAGVGGSGPFTSNNMLLLAHLPLSSIGGGGVNVLGNDIWGWTDPVFGKEYAIFGRSDGTSFIDVSTPTNPIYLGELPTYTGNTAWRDMKVYQDHVYVVADNNGSHGMQVFDLTNLRDVTSPQTFSETTHYSGFARAHNIAINTDTGYAYAVGTELHSGGLHIIDITNPASPVFAGSFSADGYTHDTQVVTYHGPDATHAGREIAFSSNEDTLTIVDVTDKQSPSELSRNEYNQSAYAHQGWLTEDHRYFLMNDELDEASHHHNTRTHIWDVSDLASPTYVGFHESSLPTRDHNLYIHGGLVYEANYTSGLRVLEMTDLASGILTEVASFDTYPTNNGLSFDGAWSVYPFFSSGTIIVSDRQNGLFVLSAAPEPGSLLLAAIGVTGLVGVRLARRRTVRK